MPKKKQFYMVKYKVKGERKFRVPCCIWPTRGEAKKHLQIIKEDMQHISKDVIESQICPYSKKRMKRNPCNCEDMLKKKMRRY